jgi:quercetin dioxygenase-like cupin family protein
MSGKTAMLVRYREVEWDRPGASADDAAPRPPAALVEAAARTGARRKRLVRGEGGFYLNRSSMPPGFRVPPHLHDHDELLVVLAGGCRFDGELGELGPDDAIVIRAHTRYGFTCGSEGMDFLTIRSGEASVSLSE